jgi:hypothetical protein
LLFNVIAFLEPFQLFFPDDVLALSPDPLAPDAFEPDDFLASG